MKRSFIFLLTAMLLLMTDLSWGQTRTDVTDVLTQEMIGVIGTTYSDWQDVTSNSTAVYAGQSGGGYNSIKLRSSNNNSGIITTSSGGIVTTVSVVWNENTYSGRTLNIYGKNTAYTSPTDLYDAELQGTLLGTIVCGTSTDLNISETYTYIGMRSNSGAMWLSEIDITWSFGCALPVAAPVFSPAGGSYANSVTVTATCATEGATIRYTTNGDDPTEASTVFPAEGITLTETTTVKARAFKADMTQSAVATASYTIFTPLTPHWVLTQHTGINGQWCTNYMIGGFVIMIDGELIQNTNYELAAFIGDELVSDGYFPDSEHNYVYYPVLNGYDLEVDPEASDNLITFRLYDHGSGQVLPYVSASVVLYSDGGDIGNPVYPFIVNFFTAETRFELVSDASTLNYGDLIIIASADGAYAMNREQNKNDRSASEVTVTNGILTWNEDELEVLPQIVELYNAAPCANGQFAMYAYEGYLNAASYTKDWLRSVSNPTNGNSVWAINITDDEAEIVAQGFNWHNLISFDGEAAFTCYTEVENPVSIYKMALVPSTYMVTSVADPIVGGIVEGAGPYQEGDECTLTATASEGFHFVNWTENGNEVSNSATYTFTVTGDRTLVANFIASNVYNNGALNGFFSVSANSMVNFSQGNLQYQPSTSIWQFAEHQYDYVGDANSNISQAYSGWIDLFGWGTSGYNHGAICYQPWSTSQTDSDYYAYGLDSYNLFDQTGQADWGYNSISNGGNPVPAMRTVCISSTTTSTPITASTDIAVDR